MIKFLKDWMLVIAIACGIAGYFIFLALPLSEAARSATHETISFVQPILLFTMLFLTFCKVRPRELVPRSWMLYLLLFQGAFWILGSAAVLIFPMGHWAIVVESAMLCMICPTATACAVVTGKLGGSESGVLTYTILINLLVAVLVPLTVPMLHPQEGVDFWTDFWLILGKVFPLLICPALLAWIVRYFAPKLHRRLLEVPNLAFYIWAASLTLAIAVSCKSIATCGLPLGLEIAIAAVSLLACALQFWAGKAIGSRFGGKCEAQNPWRKGLSVDRITAGQALGQKNTVFAIWMGYTFLTPVTSIVGGFYSLWHNAFNTWQLARKRKAMNE